MKAGQCFIQVNLLLKVSIWSHKILIFKVDGCLTEVTSNAGLTVIYGTASLFQGQDQIWALSKLKVLCKYFVCAVNHLPNPAFSLSSPLNYYTSLYILTPPPLSVWTRKFVKLTFFLLTRRPMNVIRKF